MARPRGSRVINGKYYSPEEVRNMKAKPRRRRAARMVRPIGLPLPAAVGPDVSRLDEEITRSQQRLSALLEARILITGESITTD